MSEFVECQNCGRTFFAENLECPYCHGGREDEVGDDRHSPRRAPDAGGVYGLVFGGFMWVLAGIMLYALISLRTASNSSARLHLGLECAVAAATWIGLARRRRWGRRLAIAFILGNTALALLSLVQQGQTGSLAWGPGPLAFLLFLFPFFSPQARERYSR